MPTPRIIPVLDVMGGQVVRAVGGRRSEYRPVKSRLATTADPVAVAMKLLDATGADELYVADLDAIEGRVDVSPAVVELLNEVRVRTWVDVGVSMNKDRRVLPPLPHVCPVLGCETVPRWEIVVENQSMGDDRTAFGFSLDMRNGELLGNWKGWGLRSPRDVIGMAGQVVGQVSALIVIDVARVGVGNGAGTESVCLELREHFPNVRLVTGGGIRSRVDIARLGDAGVNAVLVASALHDGTL